MSAPARDSRLVRFREVTISVLRDLPWRSATLWLIVAVNVAAIAMYFWSRGGSTTDVTIEVSGNHYEAHVDGNLAADGDVPIHPTGGVGIKLLAEDRIPSSAQPVGIDSVRVTDLKTDELLFEDDFDGKPSEDWRRVWGYWDVHRGVWAARIGGQVMVGDTTWTDYRADFKLRNVELANLFVWMQDTENFLEIDVSLVRNYRASVLLRQAGQSDHRASGNVFEMERGETIQGIFAAFLRPYPAMLGLVLVTALIALAAGWVRVPAIDSKLRSVGELILKSSNQLVISLAVFAFALLWYILFFVSDDMPHVPDSVLYVFQSKIFASFHLTAPAPPGSLAMKTSESFSIFHPHMDQVVDGRWFSHYPFGHPMFLAIGQVIHFPSLIPPLLGAACIALIYIIGRRVYSTTVGLIAATLLLFSPFFQMTASNYMSHNTAVFVILACLAFYTWQTDRRWAAMLGSGLCFGLLFNVRPLPAFAFMIPLGGIMVFDFIRAGAERRAHLVQYAAFAGGALIMLGLYVLYNTATTGDPLKPGYAEQGTFSDDTVGFAGAHTVAFGLQNQRQLLVLMQVVANGWPAFIGFGIAMLPFLMGTRYRWDYVFGVAFLSLASLNIFYKNPAVMNGPRFWYESLPFLILLSARGAIYLRDGAVAAAGWFHARLRTTDAAPAQAIAGTWVVGVVTALVIFSASGWMLQTRQAWAIPFTPAKIAGLRNFNFSDDRLLDRAGDMDLHNALVFVKKCGGWWCYGSEFWTNSPNLDGDIVWAEQQQNGFDITLLDHYPDRKLYLADYDARTIVAVTRKDIEDAVNVPRPTPTPRPAVTVP